MTVQVLRDGKIIKEWPNQKNDFVAFKYLLDHQGQSIHHAVRHEGWNVIGVDGEKEVFNYKKEVFNYKKDMTWKH